MTTTFYQLNSSEDGNPQIAKGAFGTIKIAVCKSQHKHTEKGPLQTYSYVALKTIHNALCPSREPFNSTNNKPQLTPSVFAELAALRVLSSDGHKHDNITPLLSILSSSKSSFDLHDITFVFPHCPIDLYQIILSHRFDTSKTETNLPIPVIRVALMDILNGLKHIHTVGIMHCDMKPSNILLSSKGTFQLADFGLARLILPKRANDEDLDEEESPSQAITGLCTLPYRPPEILFGSEDYQPSVDMWGVGLILCEMLSGRALFYGINVLDTLSRIISVLGTPNYDNWEGLENLRDHGKISFEQTKGIGLANVVNILEDDIWLKQLVESTVVMDPTKRCTPSEGLEHEWMQGVRMSRKDICRNFIPKAFCSDYDGYTYQANGNDGDEKMELFLLQQMKLWGAEIASAKRDFSSTYGASQGQKGNCRVDVQVSDEVTGLLSAHMNANKGA